MHKDAVIFRQNSTIYASDSTKDYVYDRKVKPYYGLPIYILRNNLRGGTNKEVSLPP